MFLTAEQLADLTDSKRKSRQIAWLSKNGYKFQLSVAGRPKVLLDEVRRQLYGGPLYSKKVVEPDFNWMKGWPDGTQQDPR